MKRSVGGGGIDVRRESVALLKTLTIPSANLSFGNGRPKQPAAGSAWGSGAWGSSSWREAGDDRQQQEGGQRRQSEPPKAKEGPNVPYIDPMGRCTPDEAT